MNSPDFFEWTLTQNLAYRIVERLDGFSEVRENRAAKSIKLTGVLPLGDAEYKTRKKARCTFEIGPNWVAQIPSVTCHEQWLIDKPHWHLYADGRLCFEFDLKWTQELTAMVDELTNGLTAEFACTWLLSSTRSLLRRHLFAWRENIGTWPPEWDFWAHGRVDAERQLVKLLRKQSRVSNLCEVTKNSRQRLEI